MFVVPSITFCAGQTFSAGNFTHCHLDADKGALVMTSGRPAAPTHPIFETDAPRALARIAAQSPRFYDACALSTTLTHLGSTEALAEYSSCQFHHLYGGVCG